MANQYKLWVLPYRRPVQNNLFRTGAKAALGVTYDDQPWRYLAEFEEVEDAVRARKAFELSKIPPMPLTYPLRFRRPDAPKFTRVQPTPPLKQPVSAPVSKPSEPPKTTQQYLEEFAKYLIANPSAQQGLFEAMRGAGWDLKSLLDAAGYSTNDVRKTMEELGGNPQAQSSPKPSE